MTNIYRSIFLFIVGVVAILIGGLFGGMLYNYTGHSCKWPLCPYKGIHYGHYKKAIIVYTGEFGTDAYKIDMLHLENPTYDGNQLDSLLHTPE